MARIGRVDIHRVEPVHTDSLGPYSEDGERYTVRYWEVLAYTDDRRFVHDHGYFTEAAAESFAEAVRLMAKHQLGVVLGEDEEQAILVFLDSLTGELPTDYIAKPPLPEKTDATPRPIPE